GVVGQAGGHEQGAQVGVAQSQGPVVVRVAGDALGRVAGEVHQNFLRRNHHVHGVPVGFDVEGAVARELHQVQRGQVAGAVIQEHVLGAGVGGVDARGVLGGVPAVDGGVELHAGVAAVPGGFGDAGHEIAGAVGAEGLTVADGAGPEVGIGFDGEHELVGDADGVV